MFLLSLRVKQLRNSWSKWVSVFPPWRMSSSTNELLLTWLNRSRTPLVSTHSERPPPPPVCFHPTGSLPDLHAILSASMNDLQWALYFCNLKGKRERETTTDAKYHFFFFLSNGWVITRRFLKSCPGCLSELAKFLTQRNIFRNSPCDYELQAPLEKAA